MSLALWSIQQALFTRLTGSHSWGSRWYAGKAPDSATRPYGVIGEKQPLPADSGTKSGADNVFTIHLWGSEQDVLQGTDEVHALLHRTPFDLSGDGFRNYDIFVLPGNIVQDNSDPHDPITHSLVPLEIWIETV